MENVEVVMDQKVSVNTSNKGTSEVSNLQKELLDLQALTK